jgi:hypothetical protein
MLGEGISAAILHEYQNRGVGAKQFAMNVKRKELQMLETS